MNVAYAMAPAQSGGGTGGLTAFVPLILMFVIFYFLLIRPQQKKAKEHPGLLHIENVVGSQTQCALTLENQ